MAQKSNSLAHTKWLCEYRIVFAPKHGRKVIHNQYRKDLGEILRQLCQWKGVEIKEGHLMPDHARMPAGIPPKTGVSSFMEYSRGRSALFMFDRHGTSSTSSGTGGSGRRATTSPPSGSTKPQSRSASGRMDASARN